MSLPSIIGAIKFRQEQYGYTQTEMARELHMAQSHYSSFLSGKRRLPYSAMRHAYRIGVPPDVLFQVETEK